MSIAERARPIAVLGLLAAGGIGVLSATQTWLTATRIDGGAPIEVSGGAAMPLLSPLSLAVLALGAVLAIVGPVLRRIVAVLAAAAGVLLAWMTAPIAFAPSLATAASTVTETTGLAGDDAIAGIVATLEPSAWPVAALVGWLVLLLAALFALVTAGRWRAGGRRFRTDEHGPHNDEGPIDAIDSWDDLSRGSDPTR